MLSDAHEAAIRLASSGAKQRFYTLPQGFSTPMAGSRSMLSASTSTPSMSTYHSPAVLPVITRPPAPLRGGSHTPLGDDSTSSPPLDALGKLRDAPSTADGCLELRRRLLLEAWERLGAPRTGALFAASVNCDALLAALGRAAATAAETASAAACGGGDGAPDACALQRQVAELQRLLDHERRHTRRLACSQVFCPQCEELVPTCG